MQFERQQYQENCVDNIVAVLKDCIRGGAGLGDFSALKPALRALQGERDIPVVNHSSHNRLDVLMETGTGKTFTYLKAMYELDKEYGLKKFVIFVPRTAIREGIIQNVGLTADYFFRDYGKRIKLHVYNTGEMSQVKQFIRDKNELSVLVLTAGSINKPTRKNARGNILLREHENLSGATSTPLNAIAKLRPVIFIDEPHLLKGAGFTESFNEYFANALCIRFGATYPADKQHQLADAVYTLDSLAAFREYLVKRIRVATVIDDDCGLKFCNARAREKRVTLLYFKDRLEYQKDLAFGEDIGASIGDSTYRGLHVVRAAKGEVFLSDRTKRSLSDDYRLPDATMRQMIRRTVESHFAKEEALLRRGIKTLSLFFIPGVADFRGGDGGDPRVKRMFEEEYESLRAAKLQEQLSDDYRAYLQRDYDAEGNLRVHDGYFAGDGARKGASKEAQEAGSVELILKKKTELLSLQTPLRFIFSVWALQEGWDNPNIFNLCKLAPSDKETSRRQQVGRGLRLAVNQRGVRQTFAHCGQDEARFYGVNTLDVVVSGQEKNFIAEIQNEILQSSYGLGGDRLTLPMLQPLLNMQQAMAFMTFLQDNGIVEFIERENAWAIRSSVSQFLKNAKAQLPAVLASKYEALLAAFAGPTGPLVVNANKPQKTVGIRAQKLREFKALWESITRKARIVYENVDDEALKDGVRDAFAAEDIAPVKVLIRQQTYNAQSNEVENTAEEEVGEVRFFDRGGRGYAEFALQFAKREKLPLPFVLDMFNRLGEARAKIGNDPKRAADRLRDIVRDEVHSNIIHSIGYSFDNDIRIGNQSRLAPLFDADGEPKADIEAHLLGRHLHTESASPSHYLYDAIPFDSNIEKDVVLRDPAQVNGRKIKVFAKLPALAIPTPYKAYNPDFAYLVETESERRIFLVVETKGYNAESDIPADERQKIDYARKFFAALQREIPDAEIVYTSRINQQDLGDLLRELSE